MLGNYRGKTVLVTGHTGFKGSWLALWLTQLGANVIGYSLPPETNPNNFTLTGLSRKIVHVEGDIRDYKKLENVIQEHQPEILFHLAAQAIVLSGYESPKETFDVNASGTVNVLEASRKSSAIKAAVIVTTDKCYDNLNWPWGYRENDNLGGHDPYSASKSMAELAVAAYRDSFFSSGPWVASARAGNVIGGGDFSTFRILPDCMRALLSGDSIKIRNPQSVRPWLYVLDALHGYLWLGAHLFGTESVYAQAWNFGPREFKAVSVENIVEKVIEYWGEGLWENLSSVDAKPEMGMLRLNWEKAANLLNWSPTYNWQQAVRDTVDWYRGYQNQEDLYALCIKQIDAYSEKIGKNYEIYSSLPQGGLPY